MTRVSTLRVYHSFNNKQSQPSQKLSQTSRPANILTSLLSANSYFTYLSSPNFLLFSFWPLHIHKRTERTLTSRQIEL